MYNMRIVTREPAIFAGHLHNNALQNSLQEDLAFEIVLSQ